MTNQQPTAVTSCVSVIESLGSGVTFSTVGMPCGTPFEHRLRDLFLALPDYPADSSPRDLEGLGDLAEALATSTVTKQGGPVDAERPATDMPTLESGAAHPCPDPLDDLAPLISLNLPVRNHPHLLYQKVWVKKR